MPPVFGFSSARSTAQKRLPDLPWASSAVARVRSGLARLSATSTDLLRVRALRLPAALCRLPARRAAPRLAGIAGIFAAVWAIGPAWAKPAAADAPAAAASAPAQPTLLAAALQSFMPEPKPLMLRGAEGEEKLSLPISPRLHVRSAVLHLVATSSVSLLASRSQLQVRLNGQTVAQIPLDPKLPQIQARIDLPLQLLKPGYDTLTFAVAQHYTLECEDPSAPELWTQIDTAQSWIELDGGLREWTPTLAQIGEIFDPKLWGPHELTILGAAPLDATQLRWGGLIAQAAALRLGYAPLHVRYLALRPGDSGGPWGFDPAGVRSGDAALVGTAAQLKPWIAPDLAQRITGPFLSIAPLDAQRQRFVLIASGRTPEEVDTALQALLALNFPYPDQQAAVVQRVQWPKLPRYAGPDMVYPNQSVPFSRLGFPTTAFEGMYGQQQLTFSLPPDLFAPGNEMVHLKLRFAYGAGLREDSVLNILLNGRFQAAIALNSRDGGYFRDYDVAIPLASFQPGANTLTFSAAMMPLITGRCIALNTENLRLTLFSDSTLTIPNAAHVTDLPNLRLWQRTGFPATVEPYGAGLTVALTRADGDLAAAAWTLVAKLAQVSKLPLRDAHWHIGTADFSGDRNVLLLGAAAQIPSALARQLPLQLGPVRTEAPYPMTVSAAGPGELNWFEQAWRWLAQLLRVSAPVPQPQTIWSTQNGIGLGSQAALMQSRLPGTTRQALTVAVADTPARLAQQVDALVSPAVWGQLQGDLVLWHGTQQLRWQQVGSSFPVGSAGLSTRIGFVLSKHPLLWAIVLLVLLTALAAVTLRLLMRFRHRHHPDVKDEPSRDEPIV